MGPYFSAWKKYAQFKGRTGRRDFWVFFLIDLSIILSLWAVAILTNDTSINDLERTPSFGPYIVADVIYVLVSLLPRMAVTVRRLHDTGRSGRWIFINLIPYLGSLILLVMLVEKSLAGSLDQSPTQRVLDEVFE